MSEKQTANKGKEVTLNDLARMIIHTVQYLMQSWKLIVVVAVLGILGGVSYVLLKGLQYSASISFVTDTEQSEASALSSYAGLAARFGLNLGSDGINGSIFAGSNVYDLMQTRKMLQSTLLTPVDIDGKQTLLINRYIEIYHLRRKWKHKPHYKNITFDTAQHNLTVYQNDVLQRVCRSLVQHNLVFPNNASGNEQTLMKVNFTSPDEAFSYLFLNKLVDNVAHFYVGTKTKRAREHLAILTKQLDSIKNDLYGAMGNVASFEDQNLNLVRQSPRVQQQKSSLRLNISSGIYQQLVAAVETARLELLKDTPLFEIIDKPVLPLEKKHPNPVLWIILGCFIGVIISASFLLLRRFYWRIVDEETRSHKSLDG